MSGLLRAAWLLMGVAAVAAGCSRQGPPQELRVGAQAVSVSLPAGWEAREESGAILLTAQPGTSQTLPTTVHLRDLGPVTPAAYRSELAAIAALWEDRKADAAAARLRTLRAPGEIFPALAKNAEFTEAWSAIVRAPTATPFAELKAGFGTVDRALEATVPAAPAAAMAWALAQVDTGARREVTARRKVAVAGRDAEEIETRDTLAQGLPRRMLLVPNDGRLLLVTTGIVSRDADIARYEAIRNSLRFTAAR